MGVTTEGRAEFAERVIAPATALLMIALQVGSNAARDALFLSSFPVTALPYFVALTALVSFPSAQYAGRLLSRFGPARIVPAAFGFSCALFVVEWSLLGPRPRTASVLLYLHATVLGAIAISTFWSSLSERLDPYSARPVFSRVVGGATLGGVLGGVGAERVAALGSSAALLLVLAAVGAMCTGGAIVLARGAQVAVRPDVPAAATGGWRELRRGPLLGVLAILTALAAMVGTLFDYSLKADVAAHVAGGAPLVRFFGVFYAATGMGAFLVQAAHLGFLRRRRLSLPTDMLSVHPIAVGAAGLMAFIAPAPWRSVFPRGADVIVRHSMFRTGYELLYTPLPQASKRSAKAIVDVASDCIGNTSGAALVFVLTRLVPRHGFLAVNLAGVVATGAELLVARRLRSRYESALRQDLIREVAVLPHVTHFTFDNVTMAFVVPPSPPPDPGPAPDVVPPRNGRPAPAGGWLAEALLDLGSGDVGRIRAALRHAEREPLLVGAVIPLLGRKEIFDEVAAALGAHGTRVAGQLSDALVDPQTPEEVRRRLPLVLQSCPSGLAIHGLVAGLADDSFKVRSRCGKALLKLTAVHPELQVPAEAAVAAAARELDEGSKERESTAHVFDLLALAYDRESMDTARRAFETGDARLRGTALAFLEATLPLTLFEKLRRRITQPLVAPHD